MMKKNYLHFLVVSIYKNIKYVGVNSKYFNWRNHEMLRTNLYKRSSPSQLLRRGQIGHDRNVTKSRFQSRLLH